MTHAPPARQTTTARLVHARHEAENAWSYVFEPETPLSYSPGQYLRYTLPHANPDNRGVTRSFTIASFPAEPNIRVTTRLSEPSSTFKRALAHMEPGTVVQTSGPFGRFVYRETDTPAVFIAGGIDITPFRSIIGDLASRKIRARITLLYTNRAPDIPFRSFFEALLPDWRELQLVYTVTQPSEDWQGPTGRINAAFIKQHVGDLAHPLFFVSGSLGSNASTTTCAPHCTAWVRQVTPRRVFVWRSRWRVLVRARAPPRGASGFGPHVGPVARTHSDPRERALLRRNACLDRDRIRSAAEEELLIPHHYVHHILRMPYDQWPDPVNRAFKHINPAIYIPLQGPSELGASGKLLEWDRTADLANITVPTLVIGARHDTMDPDHLARMADTLPRGQYLLCPQGSHLAMYDDQQVYFDGLVRFVRDVAAGGS